MGTAHTQAQQAGGEGFVSVSELGAGKLDGARCGLDGHGRIAITVARPKPPAASVALPAEELGDLGLHGGLHDQSDPQPRHILQHLTQLAAGGEEPVDLDLDLLDRRYSS